MSTRISSRHVERIPAKKYYGYHATGTVILVDGQPNHFTGESAAKDANAFQRGVERYDFVYEIEKLLKEVGATHNPDHAHKLSKDWYLDTEAGTLKITPYQHDSSLEYPHRDQHGWVAMSFSSVATAKKYLSENYTLAGFNQHSGKWNFHPSESVADPVAYLRQMLSNVLKEKAECAPATTECAPATTECAQSAPTM